jgi:hypothetical protein
MRKETYRIPRAAGDAEDGELSVSHAGGSLEQNLKRWAAQFDRRLEDVKRRTHRGPGVEVTVVEIHGAYTGMTMPGAAAPGTKAGYVLLGAVVEMTPRPADPSVSPLTFFKLVGPEKTVMAAQHDFDRMVETLYAK